MVTLELINIAGISLLLNKDGQIVEAKTAAEILIIGHMIGQKVGINIIIYFKRHGSTTARKVTV